MHAPKQFKILILLVLLSVSISTLWVQAGEPAEKKAHHGAAIQVNPVQKEMRLLDQAMQDAVHAIALGDVRSLPKKFHAVHLAAGDTSTELKSGHYKTPKASNDVEAFIALDKAFHTEMIHLVKAAKKNDVNATAKHFGALIQRCNGCHTKYR